jgi:hypothetical protein
MVLWGSIWGGKGPFCEQKSTKIDTVFDALLLIIKVLSAIFEVWAPNFFIN